MIDFGALLLILLALAAGAWAFARLWLAGPALAPPEYPPTADAVPASSEAQSEVLDLLARVTDAPAGLSLRERIALLRRRFDEFGAQAPLDGVTVRPVDAGGVPAEWLLAPGADPDRRLLYLHGGAFTMGSPLSHRALTSVFSRLANAAVLAIDYRLAPEHARLACVDDCRAAYRWILDNGPNGPTPLRRLIVAGDSAGGNLTLVTLAWARDAGLRAADAAIALSPSTDSTLSSPSLRRNLATDPMLGPQFGALVRLPAALLLWLGWLLQRVRPCDPRVSPLFGDLAGLPPLLIHASESEMLLDDARRYAAVAVQAGSPVVLRTWPGMVHVWHIFHERLPEARAALEEIRVFLQHHAPEAS